jgi:hypothetical protein
VQVWSLSGYSKEKIVTENRSNALNAGANDSAKLATVETHRQQVQEDQVEEGETNEAPGPALISPSRARNTLSFTAPKAAPDARSFRARETLATKSALGWPGT